MNVRVILYSTGVATTRLASHMQLAEGSGAACHLQRVLLQIEKRFYFIDMHFQINEI
jgi:hypothetical protein